MMKKIYIKVSVMLMTLTVLLSCGLPTRILVDAPKILSREGNVVTFEIGESNGFVLYYQVYPPNRDPEQNIDLTQSGYSREEDIFRYFGYIKSYPSFANSVLRPRFIWQPEASNSAPYVVRLDTSSGNIAIRDNSGSEVFKDRLIRYNLQDFANFRRGDDDLSSGYSSNTGQLTWAAMNTRLDVQTVSLQLSIPVYLHYTNITVG